MGVSRSSLGGSEFGEHHRFVDSLDRIVHGGQFEHGGFGEVAGFAGFPFVVLLDEDRPGKTQQGRRVGEHADDVGEHRGNFGVGPAKHGGDFGESLLNVFRIGLGEDRADD